MSFLRRRVRMSNTRTLESLPDVEFARITRT
ncbi:MAG: hypothetical protein AVDCRST_MAG34-2190 [uncultured Nocardioidaceae bacterium]|uniref:Uncharacterized protein n=1 Tax=uncultured Nocardioidaceae bacterium TaxID=253824 RepID=A0A6J4MDM1_9ACTN|nr:MAG: hypothetical protein AVDCRST_MAG34-2190 [uncultured Nocardioidaceae bacterium]